MLNINNKLSPLPA